MATILPIRLGDGDTSHTPAVADGTEVFSAAFIPISSDTGNTLVVGSDKKLFVPATSGGGGESELLIAGLSATFSDIMLSSGAGPTTVMISTAALNGGVGLMEGLFTIPESGIYLINTKVVFSISGMEAGITYNGAVSSYVQKLSEDGAPSEMLVTSSTPIFYTSVSPVGAALYPDVAQNSVVHMRLKANERIGLSVENTTGLTTTVSGLYVYIRRMHETIQES